MKPLVTLTQLEEEPETGFFGLTFAEVKAVFSKSFVVILLIAALGSVVVAFNYAAILGMVGGSAFFWFSIKKTSGNRADKPLYYHRHLKLFNNPKWIIQAQAHYQRERTNR